MALTAQRRAVTFDPNKPFSWSYSRLKNFETCAKRTFEVDVMKRFEDGGEALEFGNRIHEALAYAIGDVGGKGSAPTVMEPALEKDLGAYARGFRNMRQAGAKVSTELELAINAQFQPVEWFAKDAWYRNKIDALAISHNGLGPVALAGDWKTGKRLEDSPQLEMAAITIFSHYSHIQMVQARFIWLKSDDMDERRVKRSDCAGIWASLQPRVAAMEAAYRNPNPLQGFPPNPGRLCRRFCPVASCPFHGK